MAMTGHSWRLIWCPLLTLRGNKWMKKADATRPLRGNGTDSSHRFLMQLVLNRRPSDNQTAFLVEKAILSPHPPTWEEIHTYTVVFLWTDL